MNLRHRIGRLERLRPQQMQTPLIIRNIVDPDCAKAGAIRARTRSGTLRRASGETEAEFLTRAQRAHSVASK